MSRAACILCCLVLTAAVGCGDGGSGADHTATSAHTARINYDEQEFAADPELHANPDDIVTLRLEDPDGGYETDLDTGDAAGVDVIPYQFLETLEREFCWETDPGAELPPNGAPAYLHLVDEAGQVVLRVEQDGECVRETIAAGRYTAEFHHGASANDDRDVIFILPHDGAAAPAEAAADAATRGGDGEDSDIAIDAPTPYCPVVPREQSERATYGIMRGVDDRLGEPCPRPPKTIVHIPIEIMFMNSVCTDVSLIRGRCTYVNDRFLGVTLLATQVRVYDELYFRGPRKTLAANGSLRLEDGLVGEYFAFDGPASLVPVYGSSATSKDFLILTNGCESCNLSGVSLIGSDLDRAWLRRADLSHASLERVHLNHIWGEDTIFKSAHMAGTELAEAYLGNAQFDSAGPVDMASGQVYPAADLTGAKLGKAMLVQTNLRGATLDRADLTMATLNGADLTGASAARGVFRQATLTADVSLRGIRMTGADFTAATLNGVALTGAVGSDVILTGAKMSGANLQGAVLPDAKMEGAILDNAVLGRDTARGLAGCQLNGAYMANVDLTSADATGVSLQNARFYGRTAKAVNATFTNADLVDAELSGTDFTGATLQNATLDRAKCVNCKFNRAKLAATSVTTNDGAKFNGTRLEGADFSQATVSGCVFTNAIVSFGPGTYSVANPGEFMFVTLFAASQMGEVTTSSSVICPDAFPGPCDTQQRLLPRAGTPTPMATPTTASPTDLPDPFATPTPRRS